jgi:molybdopterin/thiamine biosynthesis adenylyltransferase
VGKICICDNGIVDEPDLNRQIFYYEEDLGKYKAEIAFKRIKKINSSIDVTITTEKLDANFKFEYDCDVIFDCLDNYTARKLLFDKISEEKYFIHAGVDAYTGQIITLKKGVTKDLSEIYAGLQDLKNIPVTPELVHIVAGFMAKEYFNILKGQPALLNKFLIINFESLGFDYLDLN